MDMMIMHSLSLLKLKVGVGTLVIASKVSYLIVVGGS